jgi:hypothetical protein
LQSQFSSFTQSSQQFSGISSRVEQIRGADCNAFSTWNPRIVWGMYLHTAPELARVAIAILSIGSSEAAVERSFSIHNIVHSNRRNRLKSTAVQREMFIRYNIYAEQLWQTPASKETNLDYMDDNEDEENGYLFHHISSADESLAEEDDDSEIITNLPTTAPNKRRKTPVDDEKRDTPVDGEYIDYEAIDLFLENYINLHGIKDNNYSWTSDRLNMLEQTAISMNIKISTTTLKKRPKFFVDVRTSNQKYSQT